MARETKTFKTKTDGFNPEKKLGQVKRNQPAKNFKHFEGDDWKDSWELDREASMGTDDEFDDDDDGDDVPPAHFDAFGAYHSDYEMSPEYEYVPFYD